MNKKSLLAILLTVSFMGVGIGNVIYNHFKASGEIKVIEYKSAGEDELNYIQDTNKSNDGYQIEKIENVNATAWVSNNEVLNLIATEKYSKFSATPNYTCSVYNIETKQEKYYDNVCIAGGEVFGVSPDGKYLLYEEGQEASNYKDINAEEYFNSSEIKNKIRLLDLSNGGIKDFEEVGVINDKKYKWIDDNKIICSDYGNENWYIKDVEGKVFMEEKFDGFMRILQTYDIAEVGDKLQGEMYYKKDSNNEDIVLCKLNLETKEKTEIKSFSTLGSTTMAGDIISASVNTQEINYYNKEGEFIKKLGDKSLKKFISHNIISTNGNKHAFIYSNADFEENSIALNIFDIKSGAIYEIAKSKNLKNSDLYNDYILEEYINTESGTREATEMIGPKLRIGNSKSQYEFAWSMNGKSLIFTYEYNSKQDNKNHTDSYIVKFE